MPQLLSATCSAPLLVAQKRSFLSGSGSGLRWPLENVSELMFTELSGIKIQEGVLKWTGF